MSLFSCRSRFKAPFWYLRASISEAFWTPWAPLGRLGGMSGWLLGPGFAVGLCIRILNAKKNEKGSGTGGGPPPKGASAEWAATCGGVGKHTFTIKSEVFVWEKHTSPKTGVRTAPLRQ